MTSKEALNKMSNYIARLGGGETLEEEQIILEDLELLEQYKNIEKELGIDLITLFKAIKKGAWAKYYGVFEYCDEVEYMFGDEIIYFYWENGKHLCFRLNGYGVTWALTKEELENDK